MNGKVCRRLRNIARTKAHSWKETTFKGSKATKIPEIRLGVVTANETNTNIRDGIFFQRKLDPMSVGAIVKKMKQLFKATASPDRNGAYDAMEYWMNFHPELLGIPAK